MYDIDDAIAELKAVRLKLPIQQYLPDDSVIKKYEEELGVKFGEDYIKFMKEASDSLANGKEALVMTPERNSPRELASFIAYASEIGMPKDWIPICEDNGDFYCITPSQKIRFLSHNGPTDEEWENLAIWIRDVWIGGA